MQTIYQQFTSIVGKYFDIPIIYPTDVVEIIILAFIIYEIMLWIKKTRAWTLLKGIIVLVLFIVLASILNLTTILWIANKTLSVGIIALMIVFQPELRKALEQLGRKNILADIFSNDNIDTNLAISEEVTDEIVRATFELAKNKTGALIVIEREISLEEYEKTGISLDSLVSSQLLINIFEHNTPLHDGAVLIRGNRIISATCYLPLSDNMFISKDLGTRHRAGLGVSEATDSLTIIVSEETGKVTVAKEGELISCKTGETLRSMLRPKVEKPVDNKKFRIWKGRGQQDEKDSVMGKTETDK